MELSPTWTLVLAPLGVLVSPFLFIRSEGLGASGHAGCSVHMPGPAGPCSPVHKPEALVAEHRWGRSGSGCLQVAGVPPLMTLEQGTEVLALEAGQPEAREPNMIEAATSPKRDGSSRPALLVPSCLSSPLARPLGEVTVDAGPWVLATQPSDSTKQPTVCRSHTHQHSLLGQGTRLQSLTAQSRLKTPSHQAGWRGHQKCKKPG